MRKQASIIIFALLLAFPSFAQEDGANIDSLRYVWKSAPNDSMKWFTATRLAVAYMNNKVDSALWWSERSLEAAEHAGSAHMISSSLKDKAIALMYQGEYESSLNLFQESLEKLGNSTANRDQLLASTILGNIGLIFSNKNDNKKAATYYKQALALKTALGDSLGMARNLSNIGLAYYNSAMYDSALVYFEKTLVLSRQLGSVFGQGLSLSNIASVYQEKNNPEKAIEFYNQALELKRQTGDQRGVSNVLNNLGAIQNKLGNFSAARNYYEEALSTVKPIGDKEFLADTYEGLSNTFAGLGDFKKAYEFHKELYMLKDTLMQELNSKNLNEMEVKFQTKQKEAQLAQQELIISRQRNRQKNFLIGGGLAIMLIIGLFQYLRNRNRIRQKEAEMALQLEKSEADKLRELDRIKSNFFANISHEFRTPLTLVLGPLEQMINGILQGDPQKYFRIMHRNASRLLQLVNQLLDLSRLEGGRMELHIAPINLAAFIRAVAFSFESLAERKQIELAVDVPDLAQPTWTDRDKLEKILVNLLSNAFKFTHDEGHIGVQGQLLSDGKTYLLEVVDNGMGISPEQLPHVFERFYTSGASEEGVEGSGIGLALTRELVELLHGAIEVESKPEIRTCFRITLPIHESAFAAKDKVSAGAIESTVVPTAKATLEPEIAEKEVIVNEDDDRPLLLIIEDNADVRAYIGDQLRDAYRIAEAINGRLGLEKATETIPDLIITDLMMPEMDGLTVSKHLKTAETTSHIPIVMLTAKADQGDKLVGLEAGADDYLVKPFNAQELKVRVANLIEQRRRLRARFAGEIVFKPTEVAVTSVDEAFLQRVLETIEENLDDETFGVVELAGEVGMSRSQLHRKLKALADKGPNEVIRDMRLQRAKELLEKGAGNASEIAFSVGFNSLAYFSKCFSDRFGVSPTEYLRSVQH